MVSSHNSVKKKTFNKSTQTEKFTIDQITNCRYNNNSFEYKIKWKNYSSSKSTWESESSLREDNINVDKYLENSQTAMIETEYVNYEEFTENFNYFLGGKIIEGQRFALIKWKRKIPTFIQLENLNRISSDYVQEFFNFRKTKLKKIEQKLGICK